MFLISYFTLLLQNMLTRVRARALAGRKTGGRGSARPRLLLPPPAPREGRSAAERDPLLSRLLFFGAAADEAPAAAAAPQPPLPPPPASNAAEQEQAAMAREVQLRLQRHRERRSRQAKRQGLAATHASGLSLRPGDGGV